MSKLICVAVLLLSILSCDNENEASRIQVSGVVQKGPFIQGAEVQIRILDSHFEPTGSVFFSETRDDFGSFSVANVNSGPVEVVTNGYFFNELAGKLSNSTIALNAIADASAGVVNVNLLTSLSADRIKYLVLSEKKSLAEASDQAQREVLNVFHIVSTDVVPFSQIDLSRSDESSAILLAVSCILLYGNDEAGLSEQIRKISTDLQEDGTLDDTSIKGALRAQSMQIFQPTVDYVINRLKERFAALGTEINPPDFFPYVDTDGDGIINLNQVRTPRFIPPAQQVPPPFTDAPYIYSTDIEVELVCATPGSTIYYTVDQTTPTTASLRYTDPIKLKGEGTHVVKAVAVKEGMDNSVVSTQDYVIKYLVGPYPKIDKLAGVYNQDILVSFAEKPNTKIYYTLDGQEPTLASDVYTAPISIAGNGTFKVLKAFAAGENVFPGKTITSYYKIDYNSNPDNPMTGLSVDEFRQLIAGKWVGQYWTYYINPDFIYYTVEADIGLDGAFQSKLVYSSWSENDTYVHYQYHKFNSINLQSVLPDGKAEGFAGVTDPEWPLADFPARVKDVILSNNGDFLSFTINYASWEHSLILVRRPE
ncbi:chitobiase/beta-hexosaminidase C-terminal domain-containing protein [Chryseolinea sp. T2]|uniref:chitobiase/beta-hexosaminidase C-terminal domain-containing protein n=1 Tax=Chryseolinea sp. T2 TaxID=3129255 RepID=UPI00307796F9